MDPAKVARLIEILQSVRQRAHMYVGENDPVLMTHFLNGLNIAAATLMGQDVQSVVWNVVRERGWSNGAKSLCHIMLERGIPPDQVIEEMVTVEIEAFQRLAQKLSEPR